MKLFVVHISFLFEHPLANCYCLACLPGRWLV